MSEQEKSMTEQEIINYLKENKNKGVAFAFMPKEVQDWCKEHQDERIFMNMTSAGWDYNKRVINILVKNAVYCLSERYKPKNVFSYWEEFGIDENGWFTTNADSDHSPVAYRWWQWQTFLSNNDDKYNAFGGWLYSNTDTGHLKEWTTIPRFIDGEGISDTCTTEDDKEVMPQFPLKIRFWRHKE